MSPPRRTLPTGARFFSAAALIAGLAAWIPRTSAAQTTSADEAWSALSVSRQAAADSKVPKISGLVAANAAEAAKIKREREARAQKFRQTAASARDFHSRNPSHPKAAEARRLEALAALEGLTPTDKPYERSAFAIAAAYRTNKANPIAARIQVAHAMESVTLVRRTPGRPWFGNPGLAETMLDRLRGEFGDRPEIWSQYLALAENSYYDAGRDVAHRIVQSPYAHESTKLLARCILERHALVRKPIDFPLTTREGRATTFSQLAGRTTIVCFWDGPRRPEGPAGLAGFKLKPPANAQWIYVSVGTPPPRPPGKSAAAAPPGTTCIETLGWRSPVVEKLRLSRLPYVCVFDEKKQLSGYGRIEEIPELLAGIGRKIAP